MFAVKEKQKLIEEGKIKKEKPLPPIAEDEIPFDIPNSWMWCQLGVVTTNSQTKVKINGKDTVVKILAASAKAGKPKTILQKILGMESVTDSYTGTQAFKDINNCMNGHTGDDRYFYMVNLCKVCQENVKNGVIQINTPAYRGFAKYIKCMESIIEQGEDGPHRIGNSVQFIYYTLAAVRRENYKDMNSFGPFFKFS